MIGFFPRNHANRLGDLNLLGFLSVVYFDVLKLIGYFKRRCLIVIDFSILVDFGRRFVNQSSANSFQTHNFQLHSTCKYY